MLLVAAAIAAAIFILLCDNPELVAEGTAEIIDESGALSELQAVNSAEAGVVALLVNTQDAENQQEKSNQAAKAADDASLDEEQFKDQLGSANAALAEANANPETLADAQPVDITAAALPAATVTPAAAPAASTSDVTAMHYPFASSVATTDEPSTPRCFCLPPQECFCANPPDAAIRAAWKEKHPFIKPKPKPKPEEIQAQQLHHTVAHLNHTMARVSTQIGSLAKVSPKAAEKLHEKQEQISAIASVPGADPVDQAAEAEKAEATAKDEISREEAVNNMKYIAGVGATEAHLNHLQGEGTNPQL